MSIEVSKHAVSSVAAALSQDPSVRSDGEKTYDEALAATVLKPGGHVRTPTTESAGSPCGFTVTTIASSARFGGTRTVVIADSFEEAVKALTESGGYFWEHSYMLAVVESFLMNQAYGGFVRERYWFRFETGERDEAGRFADGRYVAIEEPPGFERVGEFGVG